MYNLLQQCCTVIQRLVKIHVYKVTEELCIGLNNSFKKDSSEKMTRILCPPNLPPTPTFTQVHTYIILYVFGWSLSILHSAYYRLLYQRRRACLPPYYVQKYRQRTEGTRFFPTILIVSKHEICMNDSDNRVASCSQGATVGDGGRPLVRWTTEAENCYV